MDAGTATKYHFHVGDRVRILLIGPPRTFTISGIVTFGTANNLAGATLAAFDLPTAQQILGEPGQLSAVDVLAQPGADKAQLQRAIAKTLPTGVEVVTGQTVADEATNSINQALSFFSTALLGVRLHLPVRRGIHHLQHLLHHRGPAHPGAGPAPHRGGQPAPGVPLRPHRGPAPRPGGLAGGPGPGRAGRPGPRGPAQGVRHHPAHRPPGLRLPDGHRRPGRRRRCHRRVGHRPGPARRPDPTGGRPGRPPQRPGRVVPATDRDRVGGRRARHRRPDPRD